MNPTKHFIWTPSLPPRLPREAGHHHVLPGPGPCDRLLQEDALRPSGGKFLQEMFHSGPSQRWRRRRRRRLPWSRAPSQELLWHCGLRQRHWSCPVASSLPSERATAVNNSVQEQLTAQNIQQGGSAAPPGAQHGDRPAVRHHVRPGGQTLCRLRVGQDEHQGGQVPVLLLYNIAGQQLRISIFSLFSFKWFVKRFSNPLKHFFYYEEAGRLFYWDPRRLK